MQYISSEHSNYNIPYITILPKIQIKKQPKAAMEIQLMRQLVA